MKFQLVSDLHLDHFKESQQLHLPQQIVNDKDDADTLIIAGDLAECHDPIWQTSLKYFADSYEHVIYVLGNHEHYFSSLITIRSLINKLPSNVHHLENRTIELDGVRICGSTLWFPKVSNSSLESGLADFHAIPRLRDWVYQYHDIAIPSIKESNAQLVVTHHAPHPGSIALEYLGNPLNPFFIVNCTDIIEELKPAVWVHGHCHSKADYTVDSTRIISNPFGYPRENFYQVNQYIPTFFTI